MFLFGFKMLWEAWRMDDNEQEETRREVEDELAGRRNNDGKKYENNWRGR